MFFSKQQEVSQLEKVDTTELGPISQYVVQKQHEVLQLEMVGTTELGAI